MEDLTAAQIAPNSGLTQIELPDVDIQGCVYENAGNWLIHVQSATTTIHWGVRTGGYTIPILPPDAGATINCANAIAAANDMAGYQARQGVNAWHLEAASRAHEQDHVAWFHRESVDAWANTGFEATIEAHVLGAVATMTRAQAETAMRAYLDTQELAWFNAYGVAPEPPAYAVGQAVLNPMIARIRAWEAANCP